MARSIGVDPLASTKSFWGDALGLGRFYSDLAVAAAGVCMATRAVNGGLLSLADLTARLARRPRAAAATADDVARALAKLECLGGGYAIVDIAGVRYVRSVPEALDTDGAEVLAAVPRCATPGDDAWTTATAAAATLRWARDRVARALAALVREGLAWVDAQAPGGEQRFYFPALRGSG
jgi:ESCRT-II complex subunit VPS22